MGGHDPGPVALAPHTSDGALVEVQVVDPHAAQLDAAQAEALGQRRGQAVEQRVPAGGDELAQQSGPDLPWGEKPLKTQANLGGSQDGTFGFTDLKIQDKPYVVVDAVGNDAGSTDFPLANVVATASFTGSSGGTGSFAPSLTVKNVYSDSAVFA
ncbi:MAG TPA: hypothetical protein VK507_25630 [Iamia sp.]|nr:hypothetical protein [Iamia sp.]